MSQPSIALSSEGVSLPTSMLEVNPSIESDHSPMALKNTFEVFNELSLKLADSYKHLEQRVADLTNELDLVSEQRLQELQKKEQLATRLQTLISSLPAGVIVLDKHGRVIESNPVAESLLQHKLTGCLWRELIHKCFAPRDDDGHEVSTRSGKRLSMVTRSMGTDGQIILLTDQTETRRLQAELSRNERLSALGKMVSTLAHQVRTPLSSAMLYAKHLNDHPLTENQRHGFTEKILNRLHFMERQVRDMLLFVKGDIPLIDDIELPDLVQSLKEAMDIPLSTYQVNCYWDIQLDKCRLKCNLDAIMGALMNLANNSLQASPNTDLHICLKKHGDELLICIIDEGPGLVPGKEQQLTEIFFTTKEQGTGIGLSVVQVVAKSHGGSFSLKNREKGGACACLRLPLMTSNTH